MSTKEKIVFVAILLCFLGVIGFAIYRSMTGEDTMSQSAQKSKEKEDKELEELQQKIDALRPKSILNN